MATSTRIDHAAGGCDRGAPGSARDDPVMLVPMTIVIGVMGARVALEPGGPDVR